MLRIYAFLGLASSCILLVLLVAACLFRPAPLRLQAILNRAGALVLVLTGWVNVDGWAASSHLQRGGVPDVAYLKTLSADALPALKAAPASEPLVKLLAQRNSSRNPALVCLEPLVLALRPGWRDLNSRSTGLNPRKPTSFPRSARRD